jgi:hypothetical protein
VKTLFVSLSVSLLISSVAVNAKDKLVNTAGQKPMLLCYAIAPRTLDRVVDSELARGIEEQEEWRFQRHQEPQQTLTVSSVSTTPAPTQDSVEPSFASRGLFLKKTASDVMEKRGRAKFCMGNLLEGSVYDFKKKNDLHFEIAGPQSQCKENCSLLKYDSFDVSFLIRFRL